MKKKQATAATATTTTTTTTTTTSKLLSSNSLFDTLLLKLPSLLVPHVIPSEDNKYVYRNLFLLLFVLVCSGEAFRVCSISKTTEFWFVAPIILLPTWLQYEKNHPKSWDYFLWCKTISLMPLATLWISTCRTRIIMNDDTDEDEATTSKLFLPLWAIQYGSFGVLTINVFEAITKDWFTTTTTTTLDTDTTTTTTGKTTVTTSNYRSSSSSSCCNNINKNSIAGILLLVGAIPTIPTAHIQDVAPGSLVWTLNPIWIVGYTIWNITFVYDNYPYSVGRHIMVLLSPLLLSVVWIRSNSWDDWIQLRAYTLAFYFMIRCTFYTKLRAATDIKNLHPTKQQLEFVQTLSLITCCIAVINNYMNAYSSSSTTTTPSSQILVDDDTTTTSSSWISTWETCTTTNNNASSSYSITNLTWTRS